MVTRTEVPVVCYHSFWFGTGTSDVRYRNIALHDCYRNFADIIHATSHELQGLDMHEKAPGESPFKVTRQRNCSMFFPDCTLLKVVDDNDIFRDWPPHITNGVPHVTMDSS